MDKIKLKIKFSKLINKINSIKNYEKIALIGFIASFSITIGFLTWEIKDYHTFQRYIEKYSPISRGVGFNKTTNYTSGLGPHPIVLMTFGGNRHKWTTEIPSAWRPKSISDVELVLCVHKEGKKLIERCGPYIIQVGGTIYYYYIVRMQFILNADLYIAKTGERIASFTLGGGIPCSCEAIEYRKKNEIYGSHVSFSQLKDAIQPYVLS